MSKLKEKVAKGGIIALVAIVMFLILGAISWIITCGIFLSDYTVFWIRI